MKKEKKLFRKALNKKIKLKVLEESYDHKAKQIDYILRLRFGLEAGFELLISFNGIEFVVVI